MVRMTGDINTDDYEVKTCINDVSSLLWFRSPEEIFLTYISKCLHYQSLFHS